MKKNAGFANPEYLITLTLVLVILAVAVPAVNRVREKSRNLKALATLRSALARYAADTKTRGPADLSELTKGGKYLAEIPEFGLTGLHPRSAQVRLLGATDDAGGWTYSNWPGEAREGAVWINCTHTDNRGKAWSEY